MKSKKYRKKSPPPPPPTQLPKTGSNSPPRLLPLLGGEEGFCFLTRLLNSLIWIFWWFSLPLHPQPFSFTQLTCVSHHGKSSEHVRDDIHNHSAVLRHVLAVHWTGKYTKDFLGLPPSLDMRYVPVRLVSMTAFQPWRVLLFKICFYFQTYLQCHISCRAGELTCSTLFFFGLWKLVLTSPIVHKEVQPPKLFQCCWD